MKMNFFLLFIGLVSLVLSGYLNGFSATTRLGWFSLITDVLGIFVALTLFSAAAVLLKAMVSDFRQVKRNEYIRRFMPYLFGLAVLSLTLPCHAADALAVTHANPAWTPPTPIVSHLAPPAAMPVQQVLTNALKITCQICGKVTVVPGKKLMVARSSVAPGGVIQDRSASVRCWKCGEWLSVHVEVFVPAPKIQLVPAPPGCTLTFTKPKLRAPSDKP